MVAAGALYAPAAFGIGAPGQIHGASLVEMARNVDFMIVIVPGGPGTKGLISTDAFAAMKDGIKGSESKDEPKKEDAPK